MRRVAATGAVAGFVIQLLGCGGSSDSTPTGPNIDPTKPTAIALASGDGQTARIKSAVAVPPVFLVTNGAGKPLSGIAVAFSVASGGGSLAAPTGVTAVDGTVQLPAWTVGPTVGTNAVSATVAGLSPTLVSATARLPYWTVMVYMAADNTLAAFGARNLWQMAQAGVNPEVQVVVQAEFNPEAFSQAGYSPRTVDRPNYDTFRYVMDGSVSRPPNNVLIGPATDIGNVNMTDPAQLRAFVQWAEQTAPAQRNVLVLWNHGGDQAGLIEDQTSAPNVVMTLPQLAMALAGLPKFDVLYFEMCLMAGYEPLATVQNSAATVVASEDAEYVAGWDFTRFLNTIYSNVSATNQALATRLADAFDAGYVGLGLSETISAFDMSGFGAVDAALGGLANAFSNASATTLTAVAGAVSNVQRYEMGWVADAADLSDTLQARVSDAAIVNAAAAVRQAATSPNFLLTSHNRTGTLYDQRNESRSHGLTVVMPSSNPTSFMPSSGTASVSGYEQQFGGTAWAAFLQRYGPVTQNRPYAYLGSNEMTLWQVWDTSFVNRGWLEMLVLEPDGNLYGPLFGTLSPSGQFSADAHIGNANYEGWAANPYVAVGTFNFLAWLVADPTNYEPLVNVAYRIGSGALVSLYQPGTYPRLSLQHSFQTDPSATMSKVLSGAYSDLIPVANWNIAPASANANVLSSGAGQIAEQRGPAITIQQFAALRQAAKQLAILKAQRPAAAPEALRRGLSEALRVGPRLQ